jgi:cell division protein FtsQ
MFKQNRRHRRRRSEMRLGVKSIDYKTTSSRSTISITPLLKFWQKFGARLSGTLILGVLIWSLYILFTTPAFFVYGAEIQGNIAVTTQEIYAASDIDSQSVFWLSSTEVANRIMALPNIKSAAVSVSLPAEVTIKVVERQPELLWQTGETTWWVDQEGTIVPPKENVEGMLRIIDDDQQPVEPGHQVELNIIKGAQRLRLLAPDVSIIRYSRLNGLTVATPEGWPVFLGNGDEIKAKLVVLTALLADLKERNTTPAYIDVRNPLRPVYQPNAIIRIGEPAQPSLPQPVPLVPGQ